MKQVKTLFISPLIWQKIRAV
jgi:hypothetical protein